MMRSLGKDINNMTTCNLQNSLLKVHESTERLQHSIYMHSYLLTSAQNLNFGSSKPTPINETINSEQKMATCETPEQEKSYQETVKKQQHRKLYSWPSREVEMFEEEGSADTELIPKMKALDSTTHLSLATFTSLLIEFVARLDYLVDGVNELARMAKFKHEAFKQAGLTSKTVAFTSSYEPPYKVLLDQMDCPFFGL